jgi:hypothetical protein
MKYFLLATLGLAVGVAVNLISGHPKKLPEDPRVKWNLRELTTIAGLIVIALIGGTLQSYISDDKGHGQPSDIRGNDQPLDPASPSGSSPSATIPSPSPSPPTVTGSITPTSEQSLVDLTPILGGYTIQKKPGQRLDMECATNMRDDKYREVQFEIPRRYAKFRALLRPDVIMDDVRVDIRIDGLTSSSVTLHPSQTAVNVSAMISGHATFGLRLTCARPGGKVSFIQPVLLK